MGSTRPKIAVNKATRRRPGHGLTNLGADSAVLYCDFDHSIHRTDAYRTTDGIVPGSPDTPFFEFAPVLEKLLRPYPKVVLVLSMSWVPELGFTEARDRLPLASLRARLVDATYHPQDEWASVWSTIPRGRQVLGHVRHYGLTRWLAIDDDRAKFDGYEAHLIHCQQGVGLGDKDVQTLFAKRLATMFGLPESTPIDGKFLNGD
jgi:hypothetical protein